MVLPARTYADADRFQPGALASFVLEGDHQTISLQRVAAKHGARPSSYTAGGDGQNRQVLLFVSCRDIDGNRFRVARLDLDPCVAGDHVTAGKQLVFVDEEGCPLRLSVDLDDDRRVEENTLKPRD